MQIKSIAECSNGGILQYFRPPLSYHLQLRSLFCLFLSGRFTHVLLYINVHLTFYLQASPYYAIRDKYYEGPSMYIFYPCNLQPRYYRGYDFDQGGNIDGEQRVVNEMLEDLDGKHEKT